MLFHPTPALWPASRDRRSDTVGANDPSSTESARPATQAAFDFSTADMPVRTAFDLYHAVFASGAEVVREGDRFHARLTARPFTRMFVHDRWLHDVRHVRDQAMVQRTDFSHFTLTFCLAGTVTGRSEDACITLRPGELLVCDMRRPATLRMTQAHVITVPVAREVLDAAIGDAGRFHARIFAAAAVAPLRRYLQCLLAAPAPVTPEATALPCQLVSDHVCDMLSDEVARPTARSKAQRMLAAHRIIEARLDDPGFGVEALAQAIGMSRASLYRLFDPLGGVDRHLTARRVARMTRMLAEPGERDSIARLVERCGLTSESHASRVFLERTGIRPGAYRRQLDGMTPVERATQSMKSWPQELR